MTPERFVHLAQAYGADLNRWPDADREGARQLLACDDPAARSALQDAAWLDQQLDRHVAPAPDWVLIKRTVASAFTTPRLSFWARYADWWSRLGFVGVGLAGIATGMLVASLSLPISSSPDVLPSIFDHADADLILSLDADEAEQ
ncbi:hypothetical protein [Pseudomonas sp. Pseu.R1]|uniref:hypothetical protein n=1 Tax=Pseudomonas sp. Pseu.R1 TaxID=3379818 RepID=UPI003B955195